MTQAFNLSQFANKVNTSGQADLATAVTGTLPQANGGTGTTTAANGELLIGNGSGFTKSTLTAGAGMTITNASGAITLAAAGGGFTNMSVFASPGSFTTPSTTTKIKVTLVGGGGNGGAPYTQPRPYPQQPVSLAGSGGGGGGYAQGIYTVTASTTYPLTVGGVAGTSSVGSLISATGGATGNQSFIGGTGGTGTGGNINIPGEPGQNINSGNGGDSILGFGGVSPGTAGIIYGGGGSGGSYAGAQGIVIIEY